MPYQSGGGPAIRSETGSKPKGAVDASVGEGIVAKRKNDPYRRGVTWWKIKNRAYSQADDGRGELLNGDGRAGAGGSKALPRLRNAV